FLSFQLGFRRCQFRLREFDLIAVRDRVDLGQDLPGLNAVVLVGGEAYHPPGDRFGSNVHDVRLNKRIVGKRVPTTERRPLNCGRQGQDDSQAEGEDRANSPDPAPARTRSLRRRWCWWRRAWCRGVAHGVSRGVSCIVTDQAEPLPLGPMEARW